MPIKSVLVAASAFGVLAVAGTAQAGHCGNSDCTVGVDYMPSPAPIYGSMTVGNAHPMGHLRSVNFQRAPHVSIMRVHSMMPTAGLSDAPTGFTAGCHPQSTQYCRQEAGVPVSVELNQPEIAYAPIRLPDNYGAMRAPTAPVMKTGGGYDASKFAPRQYGENVFTPGIAHIPTSIVDRSPENADRALNSGRAVPQPIANGGYAPRPSMVSIPATGSVRLPTNYAAQSTPAYGGTVTLPTNYAFGATQYAPAPAMRNAPMPRPYGHAAGAPVLQHNGSYGSTVGSDGTYWEKVSGPTFMGDTLATQVICKRKVETQVVNPVIGVPVPVLTAVSTGCAAPMPHKPAGHHARYGQNMSGWTY